MVLTSCHLTTKIHHRGRGDGGGELSWTIQQVDCGRGLWMKLGAFV